MAWAKKILRVNLTDGTTSSEPLNMEWADQYLGQRGLATRYLAEEIDPKCDALGPDNKLIMATGPLTGTMASTAGRYSVVTKSPLTNCVACSNSGGFIGAEMKNAGWDMIIFEGKSPTPVYLHVENDNAQLLSAEELWGKSVWETDKSIHAAHNDDQIRIACIRPRCRAGLSLLSHHQRLAPRRRPLRRRHGHGVEEFESRLCQRHQGCRWYQGSCPFHERHRRSQASVGRQ